MIFWGAPCFGPLWLSAVCARGSTMRCQIGYSKAFCVEAWLVVGHIWLSAVHVLQSASIQSMWYIAALKSDAWHEKTQNHEGGAWVLQGVPSEKEWMLIYIYALHLCKKIKLKTRTHKRITHIHAKKQGKQQRTKEFYCFQKIKTKTQNNKRRKQTQPDCFCVCFVCVCVCVCVDCAVFSNLFVSLVGVVALWFSCVCLVGCFCSPLGFLLLSLLPIRPTQPWTRLHAALVHLATLSQWLDSNPITWPARAIEPCAHGFYLLHPSDSVAVVI